MAKRAASRKETDERFQSAVKFAIEEAVDYIDEWVAGDRAEALRLYRGDPLGNEEDGRSKVVMTEVRDTIQTMLPELLRIFCASKEIATFVPTSARTVEMAEQQTDVVNHVVMQMNGGVKLFHDWFKDALKQKTGVVKWYPEEDVEILEEDYTNLSEAQFMYLQQDEEVEVIEENIVQELVEDPMSGQMVPAPALIDCRIRRTRTKKRYKIECIPPEEFFISPNARDVETADCCGHRSFKTMSELVAMGYDPDEIKEQGNSSTEFEFNEEAQERNPALSGYHAGGNNSTTDESMRRYEYFEAYIRTDKDGDGIAELRKVCAIGNAYYVLHDEVVSEAPFAILCPDPEPHMVVGQSIADQVKDLQYIKTAVVRNTLDSLAQSINPRTAILEGAVNIDDVMNTENGAIIRMRQIGAVQPLAQPFVGQYALPMIEYLDSVRASRTGVTKASAGLDPDVLQSTTKAAVTATISAAQQRIELIARIFAETGVKRLMQGIQKMVHEHQDRPLVMRLRGQWTEVNPKSWELCSEMTINVGLGTGQKDEQLAALTGIAAKQEQILQLLGPVNPITDIRKYTNTLKKIVELSGFKETSEFLNDITDQQLQQFAQSMAQSKDKPDPAEALANIEVQKRQVEIDELKVKVATAEARLQQERDRLAKEDDRLRDKDDADIMLRAAELEMKYGGTVNTQGIMQMRDRKRNSGVPMIPMNGGGNA